MFQPTFHPEFANLEKFKENVEWLKTQGFNVTSQQIFQNDGKFNRIKEFFTPEWFELTDDNLQAAPDSPRTFKVGGVGVK